jgi:hypothetical protein
MPLPGDPVHSSAAISSRLRTVAMLLKNAAGVPLLPVLVRDGAFATGAQSAAAAAARVHAQMC